jgi:hypothetical protein
MLRKSPDNLLHPVNKVSIIRPVLDNKNVIDISRAHEDRQMNKLIRIHFLCLRIPRTEVMLRFILINIVCTDI